MEMLTQFLHFVECRLLVGVMLSSCCSCPLLCWETSCPAFLTSGPLFLLSDLTKPSPSPARKGSLDTGPSGDVQGDVWTDCRGQPVEGFLFSELCGASQSCLQGLLVSSLPSDPERNYIELPSYGRPPPSWESFP